MAKDVATLGSADSFEWNPPPALPLNLRSHLGRFGIGSDDLVVIEGLPEGAELTAGISKPDGSWSLGAAAIDNAAFIPLYENGETYTLQVCLLTPDPSDHGLPKTKGKAQITVAVPLAPLPVLEAFEDLDPKKSSLPVADSVILLPADPALKATTAPAAEPVAQAAIPPAPPIPAAPAPTPAVSPTIAAAPISVAAGAPAAAPVAERPPAAASSLDFDKHFAALRTEWQTNVKNQITAAERRLKAAHLQQLSKIQTILGQEEAGRMTAIESTCKTEMRRRAAEAEAELKVRAREHLAGLEARLRDKTAGGAPAGATADFDDRLAAARQAWLAEHEATLAGARAAWDAEESERRAREASELKAAHQRELTQLELQHIAISEVHMADAEAAWTKREAERLAAMEAKWRSEHDKRLESVLANLGTMVKGQVGQFTGAHPLPAIEPVVAAPPAVADREEHQPEASADTGDDLRWQRTAAA